MHLSHKNLIHAVKSLLEQNAVEVIFKDGSSCKYPWVWLRDCSLDPQTYILTSAMKGRRHFMRDFDIAKVRPKALDTDGSVVFVQWADGVESEYTKQWLKERNIGDPFVRAKRRRFYLDAGQTWTGKSLLLKRFDRKKFLNNDQTLHDFLTAVAEDGIAVLTNGPILPPSSSSSPSDAHQFVLKEGEDSRQQEHGDRMLEQIAERIGFPHRTHFGETFEVFAKPDASNMAYATGDELPYHTDFPSLADPPQLQMLHMCQRAREGGLSMFVDGFNIAKLMREKHPKQFELLCRIPIEYIEEGYDVHRRPNHVDPVHFDFDMVARHPVFKLDSLGSGRVVRVQFGNVMRSWFIDCHEEEPVTMIPRLYEALKMFTDLCYAPENQLIFALENGDTVLWANTRLLHARTAYRSEPGYERRIAGCYFCWDIVKSRIRLLRDRLQHPENQQSV